MLLGKKAVHAWLFSGPAGAPVKETARLLAQSLVCLHPDADGFACGHCPACRRIAENNSLDYIHLDSVKKKDIVSLQEQFENVSEGQRVYVLEDFDRATPEAANALLKFLEEPQPGITGILTASSRDNVLPTISSRCLCVGLKPASIEKKCQALDESPMARMLAASGRDLEQCAKVLEDENAAEIFFAAQQYMNEWQTWEGLYRLQREVFPAKHERSSREYVRFFTECLLYHMKQKKTQDDMWAGCLLAVQQAQDALLRPVDPLLRLDRMAFEIRKVVNG
jgi:DNA polymerase-3 subunit delta'